MWASGPVGENPMGYNKTIREKRGDLMEKKRNNGEEKFVKAIQWAFGTIEKVRKEEKQLKRTCNKTSNKSAK